MIVAMDTENTTETEQEEESVDDSASDRISFGLRGLEEHEDHMQCTLMAFPAASLWWVARLLGPLVALLCYITIIGTLVMGIGFILAMVGLLVLLAWLNRKTLRIDRQQIVLDGREFERSEVKGFRTFDVETTFISQRFGPSLQGAKIGFDYGEDGFVRYSGFYAPSEAEKVVNLLNGYLKKYS